jgi:hypothetical protein
LTAEVFGRASAAIVFGWIFTAHQVGAAVAALAAGTVREGFGDYLAAFAGAGLLCLVAAGMSLQIGRAVYQPAPMLALENRK